MESAFLVYRKTNGEIVKKNVMRTTTMIGSHPACNLQLLSSHVNEMHCLITLDGRGFRVWDLRSQSGTFVNGHRVRSTRLKPGDELTIGSFTFQLETSIHDQSREGFFIDEYRVLGILGTGGMGWLYAVEDPRTLQRFALKILMRRAEYPHVDQEELQTRFLLEGKAGEKLRHPHIVEVIDYQHRMDVEYLLLELFESLTLQELLHREGVLPIGLLCWIAQQTALGLHHIHQMGSVHRDIKPSNILVNSDSHVKICDFGLVFLGNEPIEEKLALQMGNDCLGTADYIAPEQSYNSYQIDGRADIYSLGCTMYASLTGKLPFPVAGSREKIRGHRLENPIPVREINPQISEQMAAIVERCMHKNPEHRFASALELADALAPLAQPQKVAMQFSEILAKRTQQASFRLADPKRKHYLQRIPANVASSLQMMSSQEHLAADQTVLEPPLRAEIGTHLPGDTSAATQRR